MVLLILNGDTKEKGLKGGSCQVPRIQNLTENYKTDMVLSH